MRKVGADTWLFHGFLILLKSGDKIMQYCSISNTFRSLADEKGSNKLRKARHSGILGLARLLTLKG